MKKQFFYVIILCFLFCNNAQAQEVDYKPSLKLMVRADFKGETINDTAFDNTSGFEGRYLKFVLNGSITNKLTYSYRQRINVSNGDNSSFFKSIDWIYLKYQANKNFAFAAGKQVVAIGGYEYDRAPIDLYFCSVFWNHIPCYNFGVTATFTDDAQKNALSLQIVNSPFGNNMYAYNLLWSGTFGKFSTLYSVNMLEYEKGKFINYIALGNRFVTDGFVVEFDFMNRTTESSDFFFKNISLIGELSYQISDKWRVFGKCGYDANNTDNPGDFCVVPGVEEFFYGVGGEFFPLNKKNLRIHAFWKSSDQKPMRNTFNLGITWDMKILK